MGVLDGFDAGAEPYAELLRAANVVDGTKARMVGLTTAKMEDGEVKPVALLSFIYKGRQGTYGLVLKRKNGNILARKARELGGEAELGGITVTLRLGETEFRGKSVPTVDLEVPEQGKA